MKIQVYILRQLLVAFAFAVGGVLFIALPGIAASTVSKLPNADAVILVRYLPLVLQKLIPHVLPICFLLSVVATYGRLAADREWTAIQMAGIQPLTVFGPALLLASLLGAGTYWMSSNQIPTLLRQAKDILVAATSSAITNLAPGRTRLQFGDFYLKGAWRDRETGVFREVYLHRPESPDGERIPDIFAETADIRVVDDVLYVDMTGLRVVDARNSRINEAERFTAQFPLEGLVGKVGGDSKRAKYLVSPRIRELLKGERLSRKLRRSYDYELHSRLAMSVAYLLFMALGVPTGLLMRRGTQLAALAVATGYGIVYYGLALQVGKAIGLSGDVPPWVGAWAATILGLACAAFLTRRAMRR